jgi:F-type H+-transporting ATPase subunit delta
MPIHKASKRYAKALFLLGRENGQSDLLYEDIQNFLAVMQSSADLRRFLKHPQISFQLQRQTLEALFAKHVHPSFLRFLHFLLRKNRLNLLADIAAEFERLYLVEKGTQKVQITTAHALDEDQTQKIIQRLKQRLARDVQLTIRVEPHLIGGLRIQYEDQIIDLSFENHLRRFRQRIIKGADRL